MHQPPLSPEIEAAVEDIWAHFTAQGGKAPASFDLIVGELRALAGLRAFTEAMQLQAQARKSGSGV